MSPRGLRTFLPVGTPMMICALGTQQAFCLSGRQRVFPLCNQTRCAEQNRAGQQQDHRQPASPSASRMRRLRVGVTLPDLSVLDGGLLIFSLLMAAADFASAAGLIVPAKVGGEATLPCNAERFQPLEVVEWSRPGINREFVLIFKTQHHDLDVPLASYQGRVELKDTETGDMSLVLRNVTAEDGGTYECYVLRERSRRKRAELQSISTVQLTVAPPPPGQRHLAVVVGAVVLAVLGAVTLAAGFVWRKKTSLHPSSLNEAEEPLRSV